MNWNTNLTFKEVLTSFRYWPRVFQLLWSIDKKALIIIMVFTVIGGLFPALLLLANQFLINSIALGWEQDFDIVIKGLALLVSLYVFQLITGQIKQYVEEIYKLRLSYSINVLLMRKSVNLSLEDFENDTIYDQLQRAQSEANHRPYQIFEQILSIISSAIIFISTAMILIAWKWWVVPCLLIIPILSAVSFLKLGKKEFDIEWDRAPLWRKLWYLNYLLTKDITIKEVKLYNLGSHIITQYKGIYHDFLKVDKGIAKRRLILSFTFQFINQFVIAALILLILIAAFTKEIMIGTMVSYIQALSSTQNASQSLLHQIFSMYENNLYIEQLFSYLDVEEKDQNNDENAIKLDSIHSIEFKNVSFKYPGSESYALKDVSFSLKQNDIVAIVGKNGSGKSTLVKLLTRLYKNYTGEILINDKSIDSYSVQSIRDQIGVVFQDFVKYELTARENIGFGNLNYIKDDKSLYDATLQSGAYNLIYSLPNKLDTQLGKWFSEGHQLSGGQWQKMAISRAIIKNSGMYILDEPSSALDPQAEQEVFEKFHNLTNEKIGIYISHRFSTVKHSTKILVFDEGRIIESGTHENLLKYNGVYSELYNLQASAYLNEEAIQIS
ncbi:ABC transporter ATP-binding protein [Bacillus sp. NPDC057893]|uniref:ABC transporter ATP-binding protein n=1 Tax=Bacillus sp. NPDC057893 TaxID=3346273 RepID=UPI0036719914